MKKISLVALSLVAALAFVGCAKKNNVVINSAEDLQGLKIGCQAGTTGELYVQENVKDAKLKSFKTGIDAALDLKNGAIDAIVLDELPAKEIVKRNKDLTIVDASFAVEQYAIAVKKGNKALLDSINKTIAAIKENGILLTVDLENGQKTGYFLDQKFNRKKVAELSKNKKVLEALQMQPLSDEEKASRHILARLYGPIATTKEKTRNGRGYNKDL